MKKCLSLLISVSILMMCLSGIVFTASAVDFAGGSGTIGDPYKIATAEQFELIFSSSAYAANHFIQTADIDLSGITHKPGSLTFTGTYKGQQNLANGITHRMIHLGNVSNAISTYGLFANVNGSVENIGVTGTITSTGNFIGALCGINYGTINNCFSTANISGAKFVGGIAGENRGNITNCYSTGNITGSSTYNGGITGGTTLRDSGTGSISNCYVTGSINGSGSTGGIVGCIGTDATTNTYTYNITNNYFAGTLLATTRSGCIIGSAPLVTVDGYVTVVLSNNYVLAPSNANKFYGYGIPSSGTHKAKKTFTVNDASNFYLVTDVGHGYVNPTYPKGTGVSYDALTGPSFSSALSVLDTNVWGFLVDGGRTDYKFPQLKTNPHKVEITDANITYLTTDLTVPEISLVETLINGKTKVTVDESINSDDTVKSYTVKVKDAASGLEIGTESSTSNQIDITSIINKVEKDYLISAKADNGYRKNGSDFGAEKAFTYEAISVNLLDTPVISDVAYTEKPSENYVLNWNSITDATGYVVTIGSQTVSVATNSLDITDKILTVPGDYEITVKAIGNNIESLPSDPYIASSYFGGGTGISANPYKIYNIRHLNNLRYHSSSYFEQVNDIYDEFTTPIEQFSGYYKGAGETQKIITLNINDTNQLNVGFIRDLINTGTIENIEMRGSVIANGTGTVNCVGVFAGNNSTATATGIINCINRANLTNNGSKGTGLNGNGGIVGLIKTSMIIRNCVNYGAISTPGSSYTGGIIGYSNSTEVSNCENRGSITAISNIGGIAGANYGYLFRCKNLAPIIARNSSTIGGIAGTVSKTGLAMSECYNTGNIIGLSTVGGIAGSAMAGTKDATITIENCYNTGNLYADSRVGGLFGNFGITTRITNLEVKNCYDLQAVSRKLVPYITLMSGSQGTITAKSYYYIDDGVTDTTSGFHGTKISKVYLRDELLNKDSNFARTIWSKASGYDYPQFTNYPHTAKIQAPDTIVNITVGENGTANLTGEQIITDGETFTVTITPNEGYYIGSIKLNGIEVDKDLKVETYDYTSSAITAHSTILISFKVIPPVIPQLTKSNYVFNLYEPVEVEVPNEGGTGTVIKTITGAKGITFASIYIAEGYTLTEYGMLFSKTTEIPTLEDASSLKVKATVAPNSLGQYGVLFYGAGIKEETTYFTRAYSIYEKGGEQVIIYAEPASFTPSAKL